MNRRCNAVAGRSSAVSGIEHFMLLLSLGTHIYINPIFMYKRINNISLLILLKLEEVDVSVIFNLVSKILKLHCAIR